MKNYNFRVQNPQTNKHGDYLKFKIKAENIEDGRTQVVEILRKEGINIYSFDVSTF